MSGKRQKTAHASYKQITVKQDFTRSKLLLYIYLCKCRFCISLVCKCIFCITVLCKCRFCNRLHYVYDYVYVYVYDYVYDLKRESATRARRTSRPFPSYSHFLKRDFSEPPISDSEKETLIFFYFYA